MRAQGNIDLGSIVANGVYVNDDEGGGDTGLPEELQDGVAVLLDSGASLAFDSLVAAGDVVTLSANGTLGGFVDVDTNASFFAGGDIGIDELDAGQNVSARGFNLRFGNVVSGSDVSMDSLGDTFVFSVSSLGDQEYRSLGDVDFDTLIAGGRVD